MERALKNALREGDSGKNKKRGEGHFTLTIYLFGSENWEQVFNFFKVLAVK